MKLNEPLAKLLLFAAVIITVLSAVLFINSSHEIKIDGELDTDKFNHFGAFIAGTAGILISFAGTILIYISLSHQRKDIQQNRVALGYQIKELSNQKIELKLTREVFKKQSLTAETQRFETTFFNLINLYNISKREVIYTTVGFNGQEHHLLGVSAIKKHMENTKSIYLSKIKKIENPDLIQNKVYQLTLASRSKALSALHHPIETFLTILKLLKKLQIADKDTYYEILVAQVTKTEILVYCNILIDDQRRILITESPFSNWILKTYFFDEDFYDYFFSLKAPY